MTDRAAEQLSAPQGPGRPRGRVRDFVANRSGTQRVGVVAAVLVLATAPFGGLSSAEDRQVEALALDQHIDVGPFYVTIASVRQLRSLPPIIEEDPTSRILALRIEVTNHTDRAEYAELSWNAIGGDKAGVIPWPGDSEVERRVFDVNDAVEVPDGEYVNPGATYEYAVLLRQAPDTDLDEVVLKVAGYDFQEVDPQTLDPDRWIYDDTSLAEGHVPIEVVDE